MVNSSLKKNHFVLTILFTEGDVCSPQANVEPDPSLDLLAAAGGGDVGLVLSASADGVTVPAVAEVGNQYDASDEHGREHAKSRPQSLCVREYVCDIRRRTEKKQDTWTWTNIRLHAKLDCRVRADCQSACQLQCFYRRTASNIYILQMRNRNTHTLYKTTIANLHNNRTYVLALQLRPTPPF